SATTAASAAGTAEPAWTESAATRLSEWEVRGSGTRLVPERHVRHHVGALLQFSFEEFGVLSVRDAEPQAHRFQLFVDVDPRAPRALNAGKGTKERVDRRGAIGSGDRRSGRRSSRRASRCCSSTTLRRRAVSTGGRIEAAVAHALQALIAFVW